jgi:hypothetical protein
MNGNLLQYSDPYLTRPFIWESDGDVSTLTILSKPVSPIWFYTDLLSGPILIIALIMWVHSIRISLIVPMGIFYLFGFLNTLISRQAASIRLVGRQLHIDSPLSNWLGKYFPWVVKKLSLRLDADIWQIADVKAEISGNSYRGEVLGELVIARKDGSLIRVARRRPFGELEVAARQLRYAMDLAGWAKPQTASNKS